MADKAVVERKPRAKKRKKADNVWELNGIKFKLQAVDLAYIQTVMETIEIPEPPTYTTDIAGGRTQTHIMDEQAALETEGGVETWKNYTENRDRALLEQAERMMRAAFLDGTIPPKQWYDESWERRMRITRVPIPSDGEESWVLYLVMSMEIEEKTSLVNRILSLSGVPEDMIQASEGSFPDKVQAESEESGDMEDSAAIADGDAEGEMDA